MLYFFFRNNTKSLAQKTDKNALKRITNNGIEHVKADNETTLLRHTFTLQSFLQCGCQIFQHT